MSKVQATKAGKAAKAAASEAPQLTMDDLRDRIDEGTIDTVIVCFTDMQGRLQGKRLHAGFFLNHVLDHAATGAGGGERRDDPVRPVLARWLGRGRRLAANHPQEAIGGG